MASLRSIIMRLGVLFFTVALVHAQAAAQNLLLNGSFEDTLCVGGINSVPIGYHAMHWYNPNGGTADLYGTVPTSPGCFVTDLYDPAFIQSGNWQFPSDGERMAGIICHIAPACGREYLQAPLSVPLQKGAKYCLSMKVCLAEYCALAIDRLGMHLSVDPVVVYPDPCGLYVDAHVQGAPGVFYSDTVQWMTVSGDYIALGGEQYISIGNFIPFEEVETMAVEGTSSLPSAYYYIDDVIVEQCDVQTGIAEQATELEVRWDASAGVWFMILAHGGTLELFDLGGRMVHQARAVQGRNQFDLSGLPAGTYVWSLRTNSGDRLVARVVLP